MMSHKKKLVSASLLFIGILSFNTLKADATTTDQNVQNLRYCTINNIYKTTRTDCLLRQDHILNRLDADGATRPQNGKKDGTGSGRADRPRSSDCPNYSTKQTQTTPEPAATAYDTQPQDGTGNQYGQQNNYDAAQTTTSANQQATQAQAQQVQQQEVQSQPVQQQQVRQHQQYTNQTPTQNTAPAQQQQNRVHHNNTPQRTGGHQGQHH